jgi:hypothetical protein
MRIPRVSDVGNDLGARDYRFAISALNDAHQRERLAMEYSPVLDAPDKDLNLSMAYTCATWYPTQHNLHGSATSLLLAATRAGALVALDGATGAVIESLTELLAVPSHSSGHGHGARVHISRHGSVEIFRDGASPRVKLGTIAGPNANAAPRPPRWTRRAAGGVKATVPPHRVPLPVAAPLTLREREAQIKRCGRSAGEHLAAACAVSQSLP